MATLGAYRDASNAQYYQGSFDDVYLFSEALTDSDVAFLAEGGVPLMYRIHPPPPPVTPAPS